MKKYIIGIVLATFLFGCEEWLAEEPRSVITTNLFYENAEDAEAAVNAIYAFAYEPYNKFGYDELAYTMLEVVTGHFVNVSQSSNTAEFYNLRYSSSSPYVASWFNSSYQGIEAANLAIANLPEIDMPEADKDRLLGEAKFFRAYFYYNLVNIFGDVPLKLNPTASPDDGQIPKTSVQEIYEQAIVPDLLAAEQAPLPPTPAGSGRVSLGAVKTVLTKVYLNMAGAPLNQSDKFALARDKAAEIISNNWFSLFQTDANLTWFDKLNNPAFDNTEEHILSVNYGLNLTNASIPVFFLPREVLFVRNNFIQFGGFYPSEAFLSSYTSSDLRVQNQGFVYNTFTVDDSVFTFPTAIYKFFDKGLLDTSPNSGKDFPLYRYADVLLMFAEAQNEADGSPNAAAYDAINQVRARSNLPALSGLNLENFREAVWQERYHELFAENKAWFDMVRTRKIYDSESSLFVDIVGYTLPTSGATFTEDNLTFPIPERETQINPLLTN